MSLYLNFNNKILKVAISMGLSVLFLWYTYLSSVEALSTTITVKVGDTVFFGFSVCRQESGLKILIPKMDSIAN